MAVLSFAAAAAAQSRPFSPSDLWEWREVLDPRIAADGSRAVYQERWADRATNRFRSRISLAAPGSPPRPLAQEDTAGLTCPRWSPDAAHIAYFSTLGTVTTLVTRPVEQGAVTRIALPGEPLALSWSPGGVAIAVTTRVWEPRPGIAWAPVALVPQLRVEHTRLYLVDGPGSEPHLVPLGDLEPEGEPAWMPDGHSLLLALSAPFDPSHPLDGPEIYSLRIPEFTLRRLTNHPGPDFDPVPSPDGSRIAWLAARTRCAKLCHRQALGGQPGRVASPFAGRALDRDPVQPAWSSDSRTVYFLADDRGQSRVYAARNDGSARPVLSAARLHGFSLADNGRAVAVRDTGEVILFPVDVAGEPAVLSAPNRELLTARSAATVEPFEFRSGSRPIQAWLTRPPALPTGAKLPLLLDIDDAPRRMCGADFRLRTQVLAAAGFAVLCANPRGTPGYGEAFGNLIRTGLPGDDFEDWMTGVDAVISKGLVDPSRLNVAGGLLAAWAIGHTDRFHAAVARRPVTDFTLDAATAPDGARRAAAWMGAWPWTDPEQYWKHSPVYFAGKFTSPTLIIAAEHDAAADELAFALRSRNVEHSLVRIGEERPGDLVLELEALLAWLKR